MPGNLLNGSFDRLSSADRGELSQHELDMVLFTVAAAHDMMACFWLHHFSQNLSPNANVNANVSVNAEKRQEQLQPPAVVVPLFTCWKRDTQGWTLCRQFTAIVVRMFLFLLFFVFSLPTLNRGEIDT